jgi:hypothetical protein
MDPASINRLSKRNGVPPINRSGKRKSIVQNSVQNANIATLETHICRGFAALSFIGYFAQNGKPA